MTDLIERLEAATEGSRELDKLLLEAVGWEMKWERGGLGERLVGKPPGETHWTMGGIPSPSTSIDAALTLVPEGWVPHLHFADPAWVVDRHCCLLGEPGSREIAGYAQTMALAICAAALKAQEGGRDK